MVTVAKSLPDAAARLIALTDHDRTLLVEAGAGSGKTALMAGRVAVMLTSGVAPRDIVAITFTEAAASELLERIEKFVGQLHEGKVPAELQHALAAPLSALQRENIDRGSQTLDEITCTTIHGFCQQLVRPYPVEIRIGLPGFDGGLALGAIWKRSQRRRAGPNSCDEGRRRRRRFFRRTGQHRSG
jgi:exodeoxyribonuclease-5